MNDWIPLTQDDLLSYEDATDLALLTDPAQQDLIGDVLNDLIARARAEIETGGHSPLTTDRSLIPPELRGPLCQLALHALRQRAGIPLEDAAAEAVDDAQQLLLRIAQGSLRVSTPSSAQAIPTLTRCDVISYREDALTGETLPPL